MDPREADGLDRAQGHRVVRVLVAGRRVVQRGSGRPGRREVPWGGGHACPSGMKRHCRTAARSSASVSQPCQATSPGAGATSQVITASCTPSQYGLIASWDRNVNKKRTGTSMPNSSANSLAAACS